MKLVKQGAQGVHDILWRWVANGHGGHDGIRGQKQKTGSGMKTASHECREAIRKLELTERWYMRVTRILHLQDISSW